MQRSGATTSSTFWRPCRTCHVGYGHSLSLPSSTRRAIGSSLGSTQSSIFRSARHLHHYCMTPPFQNRPDKMAAPRCIKRGDASGAPFTRLEMPCCVGPRVAQGTGLRNMIYWCEWYVGTQNCAFTYYEGTPKVRYFQMWGLSP